LILSYSALKLLIFCHGPDPVQVKFLIMKNLLRNVMSTFIRIAANLPERASGSKLPAARFALLLRSGQDAQAVIADIRSQLAPLNVKVEPLSAGQPRLLILKFPDYLMTVEPSTAFDLAHQLADRFNLENVEPEVFTDLVPEPDPKRQGRREESVDNFPSGCWVAEDPALDNKPDWPLQAMRVYDAWRFSSSTGTSLMASMSSLPSRTPASRSTRNLRALLLCGAMTSLMTSPAMTIPSTTSEIPGTARRPPAC
jgi:hypothetical protein